MTSQDLPRQRHDAILIIGPTASGKSKLGLEIAQRCHGIIINADSMQVYDVLHQLTARPGKNEIAIIPHFLYGFVSPAETFSTGRWLEAVQTLLCRPDIAGRTRVFVGGTGLYFRALLGGLSRIPPVDTEIRQKWRQFLQYNGAKALYDCLLKKDPLQAQRLSANDGQRIIRALEVFETTGRSIAEWQQMSGEPLIDSARVHKLVIMPERNKLIASINSRFDKMLENGALEEVRKLRSMQLDPALPAMKAIGVREFSACLDGTIKQEAAIEKAKTETRRYARRQMTWLRHQLDSSWWRLSSAKQASDSFL